jgi:6-phosphogluconolactonase (cycloisomerase 2 family)/peptidoglycan/LPS O-acetylase OafA/YrhL
MAFSKTNKLNGLDHLRALAIALVLLYHYCKLFPHPDWTEAWGSFGWVGVDLFFVLSGYLIASQLFEEVKENNNVNLKEFYVKRFFRIIPAYLTVVFLYFAFPVFKEREGLPPLWKFFTFTQNLGLDLKTQRAFSHAWSLCIEEQFYLLFPLGLFLFTFVSRRKFMLWSLVVLLLGTAVLRLISWNLFVAPLKGDPLFGLNWAKYIYYPTYNRLDSLLVGVGLAAISKFLPRTKEFFDRNYLVFLIVGLLLITASYFLCKEQATFNASIFGFSLVAVSFGCITSAALSPKSFLYRSESRVTWIIAVLSYSTYLLHKATIHLSQDFCSEQGLDPESTPVFWISISATFIAAGGLYLAIERPFMKLRSAILRKPGPTLVPKNVLPFLFLLFASSAFAQPQRFAAPSELKDSSFYLFVGNYTSGRPDSGIYIFKFNCNTGEVLKVTSGVQITNPSFLTVSDDGQYVYACTESKLKGGGSVSSFFFDSKKGSLKFLNKRSSMGENPVYISLFKNNQWLVNGNYTGGSISIFPIESNKTLQNATQIINYKDSSLIKERQDASHPHATVFSLDFKFLLVTDLGGDKIRSYKVNGDAKEPLELYKQFDCTPGSGPRHLTFHPNGKYCYVIEELSETVAAYNYFDGSLIPIQRIATRDTTPHISHGSADIHTSPDGKFLYASNRGDKNTITIFSVQQDGSLKLCGYQSTLGEHPRNFAIDPSGQYLLVANVGSNSIVVFKRNQENGLLSPTGITLTIPNPSCLVFRKI